jgi:DNA polymerase-3 subunit delta'
MHPSAANGILKILEEPAPNTVFILVTNAADKLLPTIISRTQIVTVPLLDDAVLEDHLVQEYKADPSKAAKVTALSEGSINLALKLLEREEDDSSERFVNWMRACYDKSYLSLVRTADEFHAMDKLSQYNLLKYSIRIMRETLLHISGANNMIRLRGEELKFMERFSKVMDIEKIEKSFTLMSDANYYLERNGSAKMIFLDLSISLSKTINP